uniref:Uncharacterized protein n=1 Tax=uncultured prokaryote TaxID=198431 RepID=A0A0H5QNT6_9ZZZZ|nr:hypothetical protein [uncultured prokaryote]
MKTRSVRLKFIGLMVRDQDVVLMARQEHLHGPAGWIPVGRILEMHLPIESLLEDTFQSAVEVARRVRINRKYREDEENQASFFD